MIWSKDRFTLGRSDYQRQYEPILYGWPEGKPHYWSGARNQGDVWNIARPFVNDLHPTMKPVELGERAIGNSSRRGDAVLDAFGGSGATLIACEKTKRKGRLIELDPKYVDVMVKRWQEYTGKEGTLAGAGRTFERFDFLGYAFGPHHFRKDGSIYMGESPSKRSVARLRQKVGDVLVSGNTQPWPEIRARLNATLRGWSNYFRQGDCYPAYRAVNHHVYDRVRAFLRRRYKVSSLGTAKYPDRVVYGELGVLRLFVRGRS